MTHILIAEKILPFLDGPIDYASYLLGTIAPDAVHASADYSGSLKERSHLCAPNARWGRIVQEDDLTEWVNSIRAFYLANKNRYEKRSAGRRFYLTFLPAAYAAAARI